MNAIACYHCDFLHTMPEMTGRSIARCVRCGAVLVRSRPESIDNTIAWTLASLVLFLVAISFPFLGMINSGMERHTALLTGVQEIYLQEMYLLAILVLLTCVAAPVLQISGLLYVFLPLRFGVKARYAELVFRLFRHIQPWNMMEVFMLGILVALVKLGDIAVIVPGVAVYAFALLIVCLAFAVSSVDAYAVWRRMEELADDR